MAHELGHILMHIWGEDNEDISKEEFNAREKQANMFASALLLPKDTFSKSVSAYPTNMESIDAGNDVQNQTVRNNFCKPVPIYDAYYV